ncbi:MAG: hypothetical protein M1438_20220 [Deltaproteobacteria bacterium]|nr:hypothetical protein [Deltaproteobacteria bacterium]
MRAKAAGGDARPTNERNIFLFLKKYGRLARGRYNHKTRAGCENCTPCLTEFIMKYNERTIEKIYQENLIAARQLLASLPIAEGREPKATFSINKRTGTSLWKSQN